MHFLLSCQQALQKHQVPAYGFWEDYFKNGIEEAGHQWIEVKEVDWAEGLTYLNEEDLSKWRDRTWNRTIECIKSHHAKQPIDLFLSYLFPKQVEPIAVREIQDLGIPCVNFFCDNVREFTQVPKEFFCFDLHWVPEFKALKLYQQAQLNYVYAPMPVWVPPKHRTYEHPENYGVSFIGSRDVQREALLAQVVSTGVDLEIRGAGWNASDASAVVHLPRQTPWQTGCNQLQFLSQQGMIPWVRKLSSKFRSRISDETFAKSVKLQPSANSYINILQQSQITLGINRYPSFRHPFTHPDTYSRMRDVEAPMMGACYLTEWTEGLDHLYELGEEIETYRTAEEMVEKIQVLLADPKRRRELRRRGQSKALTEHTICGSLAKITQSLDLRKPPVS